MPALCPGRAIYLCSGGPSVSFPEILFVFRGLEILHEPQREKGDNRKNNRCVVSAEPYCRADRSCSP
ncbi:hypothetical protein PMI07_006183 [Rhizobium sp. CF080]|nr:hypothetical protein PMI07_006183 [Rhizobium sp. CF080]